MEVRNVCESYPRGRILYPVFLPEETYPRRNLFYKTLRDAVRERSQSGRGMYLCDCTVRLSGERAEVRVHVRVRIGGQSTDTRTLLHRWEGDALLLPEKTQRHALNLRRLLDFLHLSRYNKDRKTQERTE